MKDLFMPTGDLIAALKNADKKARNDLDIEESVDTVFEHAIAKINQLTTDNDNLRKNT
jgi:hypothetical protein